MALRKNHLELLELKNMLKKTEIFLEESRLGFIDADENTSKRTLNLVEVARNCHLVPQNALSNWQTGAQQACGKIILTNLRI